MLNKNMDPLLVLCIDIDNDLYEKAKIRGPIIGRDQNINAATKLAIKDPEDTDANTIFYAIKMYDELKNEGEDVIIATLTGHKSMGYKAMKEISIQLDNIIKEYHVQRCIFVSDGASDEEILPIIKSRLKIDATKVVVMKQAKELEKTYFVILEKLKDPYYSRIILGIPAIIIFLLSAMSFFNIGWQPIGMILGTYLILKGFEIDEWFINLIKEFKFSIDKISWIAYIISSGLFLMSLIVMVQTYSQLTNLPIEKIIAKTIDSGLLIAQWGFLLIILGKIIDARIEKRTFAIPKYGLYAISFLLITMMIRVGTKWIINDTPPYVSFGDFFETILLGLVIGYASIKAINMMMKEVIEEMKLNGMEVISEFGSRLGKIKGVDLKNKLLIIQNPFDRISKIKIENIKSIENNVITIRNQ